MSRPRYKLTSKQMAQAKQMWAQGKASHEIYRAIGVTHDCFNYARKYGQLKSLPSRGKGGKGVRKKQNYTPTPEEIEAAAKVIRRTWGYHETEMRRHGHLGKRYERERRLNPELPDEFVNEDVLADEVPIDEWPMFFGDWYVLKQR